MNETDLQKEVFSHLTTKNDSSNLISIIDILLNALYVSDIDTFEKDLHNAAPSWFSEIVRNCDKLEIKKGDFLNNLSTSIKNLKEINIEIANEPTEDLKDAIKNWISTNLGPNVIADFEIKESILGGATISYNGRYVDYSLGKRLDGVVERMRGEITKTIITNTK